MIKLKIDISKIVWFFLIITVAGYILSTLCKSTLPSLFFACSFVAACMCIFFCIIRLRCIGITDIFWLGALLTMIACTNVFMGNVTNRTIGYFGKVLRFSITIMLMYICTRYKIKKGIVTCFQIVTQILIVQLIYQGFVVGETYYIYDTLTLGFPNPNHAGMYAALCFSNVIWSFGGSDSKIKKIFYLTEMFILFYLLICTKCRSGMLCVAGVTGLSILAFIKAKKKKMKVWKKSSYKVLGIAAFSFTSIFPIIYLGLFYANVKIDKVSGQDFYSGREQLWYDSLLELRKRFFIGVYNEVSLGTGQSQLCNIYIDVLCSYGIVVFVLFLWYMFCVVMGQAKKVYTLQQHIAFSAFLMLFFIGGTYEAAYVSGDMAINYWPCLYLLLINKDVPRWGTYKFGAFFKYMENV